MCQSAGHCSIDFATHCTLGGGSRIKLLCYIPRIGNTGETSDCKLSLLHIVCNTHQCNVKIKLRHKFHYGLAMHFACEHLRQVRLDVQQQTFATNRLPSSYQLGLLGCLATLGLCQLQLNSLQFCLQGCYHCSNVCCSWLACHCVYSNILIHKIAAVHPCCKASTAALTHYFHLN